MRALIIVAILAALVVWAVVTGNFGHDLPNFQWG